MLGPSHLARPDQEAACLCRHRPQAAGIGLASRQRNDTPCGRELPRRLAPDPGTPARRSYEDVVVARLRAEFGYQPVVPPGASRRRLWRCDRASYRRRNEIMHFHRIAVLSDKLDQIYLASVHLFLIYDMLNEMRAGLAGC